ncbi:ATP phosphoribosyltransferase [Chitinivibrio alkaliphilus]|uniref:ATP phosphoribosyltransferase n=1 Tax=Chitinivibrio alkaliphilus ACht1 TaxID=1313304 RepID=U7DBR7_9BACT|nr:ATP phosphoribosyltransferase [Chitinivibrio alkaliphilus]ERP39028.1 ATP phosphoribosyltransferase [Chitinivibrio alkaliphilus ACht1]
MVKIAIPNKGSLSEKSVQLIKEAGYACKRRSRELVVRDTTHQIEFYYLRPRDIATYVHDGIVDLGITGRDLAIDSKREYHELLPLHFGKSRFYYAVPAHLDITPDDLDNKRIATSYPTLVEQDMAKRGNTVQVVPLSGAIEISIQLDVADAIADVVESGQTLKEAGLKTIGDPIMHSEAILISKASHADKDSDIATFMTRIEGILRARSYVLVEYDAPRAKLDTLTELTPGVEAPTISPLTEDGWVAVKSMVKKKGINILIDQLYDRGARGIFVSEIKTCRI